MERLPASAHKLHAVTPIQESSVSVTTVGDGAARWTFMDVPPIAH